MGVVIQISQLLLSLSILIILHELGHFLFARLFNTRVEKFYLFFDPWFSLFKIKRGDTEYGIGWLPLGGYVKISGMLDESMDKEAAQTTSPTLGIQVENHRTATADHAGWCDREPDPWIPDLFCCFVYLG